MKDYYQGEDPFFFRFPIEGDCLNQYDGEETPRGLKIEVAICGRPDGDILINGKPATKNGSFYLCPVRLKWGKNILSLQDQTSGFRSEISVYRLRNAVGGYRISSDDNILFLKDINDHQDTYTSIFDNPYLAIYKKAHELYDAKVHLNLFYRYTEEEMADFAEHKEYFDLSMMTDRFKSEWQANAHWLSLSFHADRNFPASPYKNATAEQVTRDMERVHREILRFAGPDSLSVATTLHYGAANEEVTHALRNAGYRALAGYFEFDKRGNTLVAYHYPKELVAHIGQRDFWYDEQENILFARIDQVLNAEKEPERLIEHLEEIKKDPYRSGFLSLLMHEEYFYPDYKQHRPKFEELVLEPAKWCYENGYRGCLLSEVLADD